MGVKWRRDDARPELTGGGRLVGEAVLPVLEAEFKTWIKEIGK